MSDRMWDLNILAANILLVIGLILWMMKFMKRMVKILKLMRATRTEMKTEIECGLGLIELMDRALAKRMEID